MVLNFVPLDHTKDFLLLNNSLLIQVVLIVKIKVDNGYYPIVSTGNGPNQQ